METGAEEANPSLAQIGDNSIRLFSSLITALANLDSSTIEASRAAIDNETQRFDLWAQNLGLTLPAHKGLDYRLQNAPSLRMTVHAFLEDLNESLTEIIKLLSDHTQANKRGFQGGEEQLLTGDLGVKPSTATQLDEPQSDIDSQESESLESALKGLARDISDIVDKLYEIAFIIRSPAARTGLAKRNLSKYFDPKTTSALEAIESRRLQDHIWQSRGNDPNRPSEYAHRNPTHPLGYDVVMIQRLARANTQRRQQLIFWRRREDSRRKSIPDTEPITLSVPAHRASVEQRLMNESSPSKAYSRDTKEPPVSYTVSRADDKLLAAQDRLTPSISTRTPTAYGISGVKVDWPPRPDLTGGDWFECPYCFEICPAHYCKHDEWRAHLTHDILPYMCTYVPCTEGSQLYASRKEWINHERTAHRMIWRCAKHPRLEFADRSLYVNHMKEEHPADLAASHSLSLEIIDSHLSVSVNPDRDCPFCYAGLTTTEEMENHLAFHLESIAIFALPKNDAIEEGKTDESVSLLKQGMAMERDSRKNDFGHLSPWFEGDEHEFSFQAQASQSQTLTSEILQSYTASLPAMGYMSIVEPFLRQLTLDSPPDEHEEKVDSGQVQISYLKPGVIVILVTGIAGVGKSSFIKLLTDDDVVIGRGLESCTTSVDIFKCSTAKVPEFYLVDTPGFDDTIKSDTEILMDVAGWLNRTYEEKILLTGIIYLHRINDVRVGGAGMKSLRTFKELCGPVFLSKVVLATTFWSVVSLATGNAREEQLKTDDKFWGSMIKNGSKVFRHDRSQESASQIVESLVSLRSDQDQEIPLAIQEQMVDEGKTLDETGAGMEVESQLIAQKKAYEQMLASIRKDLEEALAARDEEWQKELLELREDIEKKIKKAKLNQQKLKADKKALIKRLDEQLKNEQSNEMDRIELLVKELESMRQERAAWERRQELRHKIDVLKARTVQASQCCMM